MAAKSTATRTIAAATVATSFGSIRGLVRLRDLILIPPPESGNRGSSPSRSMSWSADRTSSSSVVADMIDHLPFES
jgi:hypothetical protein